MAAAGNNYYLKGLEGLTNLEVVKRDHSGRPRDGGVGAGLINHASKLSVVEEQENPTTFGPVHFVKELKIGGFGVK